MRGAGAARPIADGAQGIARRLPDLDVAPFARRLRKSEIDLVGEALRGLSWDPVFQLVMHVDDSEEAIARCRVTLASLAEQSFGGWRLGLATRRRDIAFDRLVERLRDGHDDARVLRDRALAWSGATSGLRNRVLEGFDELTERVELVVPRPETSFADLVVGLDGHPVFIAVIGAGDQLRNDALAELALATGLDRGGELFYCDEERINPATGAVEPFRKPQWSPDLLLSTNYIGRLWCAAPRIFARAGGLLRDWLPHGDYDLLLRCTEQAGSIRHVPETLCRRWGGDGLDGEALESAAVSRALARRGIAADVEPAFRTGFYRVRRRVENPRRVSIIIPTRASRGLIRRCIDTLRRLTDYPDFEIVGIDDIPASDRETKQWLRENADAVVAAEPPFNWSRYNNIGARAATGEYLLFLNDDIEIAELDWLTVLVGQAQRREVGAVGARLLYPGGTVQHAGMFLTGPWHARHAFRHKHRDDPGYFGLARTQRNVTGLTGACLMTRRDVFETLGGFDEAHDIVNNDLDFCLKVRRAGLLCVYAPEATLIHHEQGTRTGGSDHFDVDAFAREWGDVFAHVDPYHHPALATNVDDFVADPESSEAVWAARPLFDADSVRRLLVVVVAPAGDCVGAIPAIRRLKGRFPRARLDVLAGGWSDAVWSPVPEVDEVIRVALREAQLPVLPGAVDAAERDRLRRVLAPRRYDLAIDLQRHPDTRPLLQPAAARYTAGFDRRRTFPWLDIALEWEGDRHGVAERRFFGDALTALVDAVAAAGEHDDMAPRLAAAPAAGFCDPDLEAAFCRRVVCVCPTARDEMRRWPPEHFARLIDLLIESEDVNAVLIGEPDDDGAAATQAVHDSVRRRDRVVVAAGRLSLEALPAFLARCALFVGNVGRASRLAAAIGVPVVGVHAGQADAREWAPGGPRAVAVRRRVECAPCHLSRPAECRRGLACLTELRPIDVYPLCRRLLALKWGTAPDA